MKRILCIFFLSSLFLQLPAQVTSVKKPSTLVFHIFYNDFQTAQKIKASSVSNVLDNNQWSKIGDMQMGFGFNYLKGISKKIDAVATLDGSSTDYLFKNGTTNGSSQFLLDANAALNLKLLADHHKVVPYLTSGAGFSSYKGKTGFYIPTGMGIQFKLADEAFILTNLQYKFALSGDVNDHFYYSVGIGTPISKKKAKPAKPIITPLPETAKKEVITFSKNLVIAVIDEATKAPLPYVSVVVSGSDGEKLSGSTNAEGKITFNKITPAEYTVSGLLNNINTSTQSIKTDHFQAANSELNITISHNDPRFTLSGVVINKTRNMPEGGAEINVTNETKHSTITNQSQAGEGVFNAQLDAESDFTLVGKKANYISNIEKISTKGLNRSATLYVKLELAIEEAKVGQSIVLYNIYFETGKANLNSLSSDLTKLVQFLKDNPETRLEIQGHTDNVGNSALNVKLSKARSNSVINHLKINGVDSNRLSAKGFGSSLPVANNTTAQGRAKNRRVVIKVLN
jgi:outer membrane protein OmpA-like peptidoglycan-associated protein